MTRGSKVQYSREDQTEHLAEDGGRGEGVRLHLTNKPQNTSVPVHARRRQPLLDLGEQFSLVLLDTPAPDTHRIRTHVDLLHRI